MEENGRTRLPASFSLRAICCLANNVDRVAFSRGERTIEDLRDETNRCRLGKDRQRGSMEADRVVARTSFGSTNDTFREIVLRGDMNVWFAQTGTFIELGVGDSPRRCIRRSRNVRG